MSVKKVFLTWEDINSLLDNIYQQTKGQVGYVTGVPRGGTILAILYSHRFGIEYMENPSNHYPSLLVLDDIADTGETLKQLQYKFPQPLYATLHYKKQSTFKPDYFAQHIGPEWIVYPWEKKDSKTIQGYLDTTK